MAMTETRHGDWMQTVSGRQFWPMDPRPQEIHIEDIAHAQLCGFQAGGNNKTPPFHQWCHSDTMSLPYMVLI